MKTKDTLIISAGFVLAAFIWGSFFYQSKTDVKTIRVVGSASKRFQTDIVKWQLSVVRNTPGKDVTDAYPALSADIDKIVSELTDRGIERSAISVQPLNTMPMHNREGVISSYRVRQSMTIISENVDTIEGLALDPAAFVSKDIIVENSRLEYYYSKVDEIKRQLLGEASKDARMRASEIAGGSGVGVGKIRSARAGVFQITEPFSTEVSGYGVYNTSSREKDIKVTVHVEFELN